MIDIKYRNVSGPISGGLTDVPGILVGNAEDESKSERVVQSSFVQMERFLEWM